MTGIFWGDRGHCPKCGRFCGQITGYGNEIQGLVRVTGICHQHGEVDLTKQEWIYDEFFGPEEGLKEKEYAKGPIGD